MRQGENAQVDILNSEDKLDRILLTRFDWVRERNALGDSRGDRMQGHTRAAPFELDPAWLFGLGKAPASEP